MCTVHACSCVCSSCVFMCVQFMRVHVCTVRVHVCTVRVHVCTVHACSCVYSSCVFMCVQCVFMCVHRTAQLRISRSSFQLYILYLCVCILILLPAAIRTSVCAVCAVFLFTLLSRYTCITRMRMRCVLCMYYNLMYGCCILYCKGK